MALGGIDTIQHVKKGKPFQRGDIFVYFPLLLLIAGLFWHFVFAAAAPSLSRISVYHEDRQGNETLVFAYDYLGDLYMVDELWRDRVSVTKANGAYEVSLGGLGEDGTGYNSLLLLPAGEAYIAQANCSARRDCTHFPHITRGNMAIACVPHRLKIVGDGEAFPPDKNPDEVDLILGRLP